MGTFDVTNQRGLKALALAKKHAAVLDPRLPAGHAAALQRYLEQLGVAVPEQKATRSEVSQTARAQKDAFEKLVMLLGAIRTSVKNDADAEASDRKEYAIGARLGPRLPKATLAAAAGVIRVAKTNPARAQLLGILPADIAQLESLHAAAVIADEQEDAKRATAPMSTRARNVVSAQVDVAVRKIAGVGVLAFAFDATTRADFEALLERSGSTKKSAAI